MTQVVNNDKLILKLTDYGLQRIAYAVENPTANLNITKIRIGSGNNFEYYEPSSSQTNLMGDLGYEFYIYTKELLEDGYTICFFTIIPEDVGGFEIREIGLYETYGGEDHLFAIGTQQPFVKPSFDDNYFINIDYYIFLKSQNFSTIYDQITLDVQHALVTEPDLEELMRTFLFAQGNLMVQIGNNSEIIGYDRAAQLYDEIRNNKKTYSYVTLYKNFASLVDNISSTDNIFSYWAFDYSRRKTQTNSIIDVGTHGYALSTNKYINNYPQVFNGFTSMFSFREPDYFKLNPEILLNLSDPSTQTDLPFSMIFVVEPLDTTSDRTLIAKSDYSLGAHTIEVSELTDRSIQVKLFSDANNYLTFKTIQNSVPLGPHAIVTSYNPVDRTMTFYINSTKYVVTAIQTGENYTCIKENPPILCAYECAPKYEIYVERNNSGNPVRLFEYTDTNQLATYIGEDWTIENNKVLYKGNEASFNPEKGSEELDKLYGWIPPSGVVSLDKKIYTKILPEDLENPVFDYPVTLYDENYHEYEGDDFGVEMDDITGFFLIKFYQNNSSYNAVYDSDYNIPLDGQSLIEVYNYKYQMENAFIFTNSDINPSILYTEDEEGRHPIYTGDEWTIKNKQVYRLGQLATRNPNKDVSTTGTALTSYIVNSNGYPSQYINSNVGIISIIKEGLSDTKARIMALNLCASIGLNPYLGGI